MTADKTSDNMDLDAHAVRPNKANAAASSLGLMQKPNFKINSQRKSARRRFFSSNFKSISSSSSSCRVVRCDSQHRSSHQSTHHDGRSSNATESTTTCSACTNSRSWSCLSQGRLGCNHQCRNQQCRSNTRFHGHPFEKIMDPGPESNTTSKPNQIPRKVTPFFIARIKKCCEKSKCIGPRRASYKIPQHPITPCANHR